MTSPPTAGATHLANPHRDQRWHHWPVRLFKAARSVQLFGYADRFASLQAYASELLRQGEDFTFSGHLMGTCRMGNDPSKSVVDRNHRAHDVANLFVVDGSSFVTSARQQPTCTIQALAYRAAALMADAARKGKIR